MVAGGDELEKKKRGDFRDTAYWQGVVVTDKSGRATITFTLPDNLTEWQAESVAVTKNTKVGAGYATFVSRKKLMVTPLQPRFILPGDEFLLGATVFNERDEEVEIDVALHSATLELRGKTRTSLTLPPHASLPVYFSVKAPTDALERAHVYTFEARSTNDEDVVENRIPVKSSGTTESMATAGRTSGSTAFEDVYIPEHVSRKEGALAFSVHATMADFVNKATLELISYPYECAEQIGSKLRAIAIATKQMALFPDLNLLPKEVTGGTKGGEKTAVSLALAKLYRNIHDDGSVSFYPGSMPDTWTTIATLETFIDLREAGYDVDPLMFSRVAGYVSQWVLTPVALYPHPATESEIIRGAYALHRLGDKALLTPSIIEKVRGYAKNATLPEQLETTALAYLAILSSEHDLGAVATNRLFAEFENRSHVDARGTTVTGRGRSGAWYENEIVSTALALKAFAETKRDSPLLEGYLRTLKNARGSDGAWNSSYNAITVIDSLVRYLTWKNEANAHFDFSVSLGNREVLAGRFDQMNIRSTFATSVPLTFLSDTRTRITFTKRDLGKSVDAFYYDLLLSYVLPAKAVPALDEGFAIERALYRLDDTTNAHPVTSATQGELLRGRVVLRTPVTRQHVAIEDFVPAGVEIVNQTLATEDPSLGMKSDEEEYWGDNERFGSAPRDAGAQKSRGLLAQIFSFGKPSSGKADAHDFLPDEFFAPEKRRVSFYPTAIERHDDRIFVYKDSLEPGEYVYEYYVRALVPGEYQYLPARVSELYAPENFGRTAGGEFVVKEK